MRVLLCPSANAACTECTPLAMMLSRQGSLVSLSKCSRHSMDTLHEDEAVYGLLAVTCQVQDHATLRAS